MAGASDAVEPELVDGPGGRVADDGWYSDQIEVGEHQLRVALRAISGTSEVTRDKQRHQVSSYEERGILSNVGAIRI